MKLVQPWTIGPIALASAALIRFWLGSTRMFFHADDYAADPRLAPAKGIYLFWHESILFPTYSHGRHGFSVLIGKHSDGEIIARITKILGFGAVRGSSSRAGLSALRGLMRSGKLNHLAITPDGPRGPRRVVQQGAIYLASKTGMPIWPIGFAFKGCWRLGNWDKFILPHPFTAGYCQVGNALYIPPDLTEDQFECHRQRVQGAMDNVQSRAEAKVLRCI